MINIGGDPTDPFYRYKREKVAITTSKKGTTIRNLDNIAKSLNRPPQDLLGYIAKSLSTFVVNKVSYTIAGMKTIDVIETTIIRFTIDNVLCKKCGNPETIGSTDGNTCKACGAVT